MPNIRTRRSGSRTIARDVFLPSLVLTLLVSSALPQERLVEHVTDGFIGLSLVQDRRGFLWCGTSNGLLCYDGYAGEFLRHDESNRNTLSHDQVNALALAPDGQIWVGTPVGLNLLNPVTRKLRRFHLFLSSGGAGGEAYITAMLMDSGGTLWLGTQEDGLLEVAPHHRARGDSLLVRQHTCRSGDTASLSHAHVHAIERDVVGNGRFLLVGTSFGLCRYDRVNETVERYFHDPADPGSIPHDEVWSILVDAEKNVWLATGEGVCRLLRGPTGKVWFERLPLQVGGPVFTVARDTQGYLWFGTHRSEIVRYDLAAGSAQRQSLEREFDGRRYGNAVYASLCDRHGDVWFAVHYGLERHDPMRKPFVFVPISPPPGRWLVESADFCEDATGDLWIGTTARGLFRQNRRTGAVTNYVHHPDDPGSVSSDEVTTLLRDRSGKLWVGTALGLDRYRPESDTFEHLFPDPSGAGLRQSLPGRCVYALLEDRRGDLWIATNGGLSRMDRLSGRLTNYLHHGEMADLGSYIGALCQPLTWSDGSLLLASRGLYRFFPASGTLTQYRHVDSIPGSQVDHLIFGLRQDRHGNVWATTFAGLFCLGADGSFRHLSAPDPLPSNLVCQTVEDAEGTVWISTANRGLVRHIPVKGEFAPLVMHEGFLKNSFYVRGAFRGADGTVYFGAPNGFLKFQPKSIRNDPRPPFVRITRLQVFDRPLVVDDPLEVIPEIVLSHAENMLTFDFVALWYSDPEKIRYVYRLEGLSDDWIQSASRRSATFASLDPGTYVFRVKACNADGIWNEEGASVRLVIDPPFWQTWWFRALGILLLAMALYVGYRYRVQRILAVERLRLRIANDLHDDIGSELSGIALESDMLARRLSDPARERLQMIGRTIRGAADNLRDVVWIINPDEDSIEDLVERMREIAAKMMGAVPCEFVVKGAGSRELPGMEFKRHLLLMFKEMLHNCARHAQAARAEVHFALTDRHLHLCVRDDGVGFDVSASHSGRGLRSMRARASAIGAELTIESAPGRGTVICLDADMPRL